MRDALGRVEIVVVPGEENLSARQPVELVALGANKCALVATHIPNIGDGRSSSLEYVFDSIRPVVKDDPLHAIFRIVLGLVAGNRIGQETAPVVCGR